VILEDPEKTHFLLPLPEGFERLQEAQVAFALAARYGSQVWRTAAAETDPQEDDVLGYLDENGNGQMDDGESFYFLGAEYSALLNDFVPSLTAVLDELHTSFAQSTPIDAYPLTYQTFDTAVFNLLLEDLGLPPLIPSSEADIAAFFEDPPMADVKTFITDGLHCAVDSQTSLEMIFCFVWLF